MGLSEIERAQAERAMGFLLEKRRPPTHIRPELDIQCRITNRSVEVVEVRPRWRRPGEVAEHPCAKATYVRNRGVWRVFWMRADLKWHRYDPAPEVRRLEQFAKLVAEDKHACFFG